MGRHHRSSVDETSMKSATAKWIEIKKSIDSWPVDYGNLMGFNGYIMDLDISNCLTV